MEILGSTGMLKYQKVVASSPHRFLKLAGGEKDLRVLELPTPPLLQPLPNHSPTKQETGLGYLPRLLLGQEVQETSEKDPLQHRRRLLRNPGEGKINPFSHRRKISTLSQ